MLNMILKQVMLLLCNLIISTYLVTTSAIGMGVSVSAGITTYTFRTVEPNLSLQFRIYMYIGISQG